MATIQILQFKGSLFKWSSKRPLKKNRIKLKKMEEFIRRYKAGVKSKQARGREKILNRMEKMENPVITTQKIKLQFETKASSADLVLETKKLSEKILWWKRTFKNLDMKFLGEIELVLVKMVQSTLLKIINDIEKQNEGTFRIGDRVSIGYYMIKLIKA